MNTIIAWLVSIMTTVAPPQKLASLPQLPGYEETAEEKEQRYADIAKDLYEVVYDPSFRPIYGGDKGRAVTAATVLAIAWHESGFARDVDKGPCYRGANGKGTRCDGGMSACLMQIRIGSGTTTKAHGVAGLTQDDLFRDRKACFRAGIKLIRNSFAACVKEGPDHRLNAYASGVCGIGHQRSKEMFAIHRRMISAKPVPVADKDFILAEPDPDMPKENPLSLLVSD